MKILGGSLSLWTRSFGQSRKDSAMPLFICHRCKCVDNTAASDFWLRAREGTPERLCTECTTGKWHGRFPKDPTPARRSSGLRAPGLQDDWPPTARADVLRLSRPEHSPGVDLPAVLFVYSYPKP
jgi:hypothetical protein